MSFTNILLYTAVITMSTCSKSPVTIPGHAHNDYEHDKPLIEALENGFISVEADVHLIDDELFVSHNYPKELDPRLTLEALYLNPLINVISSNKGKIYKNYSGPFYLFVDVKSEAEATYEKLNSILKDYNAIMCSYKGHQFIERNITVVLSGNRAIETILKEERKLIFIDGRPSDLEKDISSTFMPFISENYNKILSWTGEGEIDKDEKEAFLALVNKCHIQGKKLRLWASPENENVWSFLLDNGADLINTDKLNEFNAFMIR